MATFWVSANGTDTNSGTNYALAKKTFANGLGLLDTGDTLNIVNDGTHLLLTTAEHNNAAQGSIAGTTRCRGTSWAAPGCIIQGTDSSGNAAMATLSSSRADARYFGVRFVFQAAYVTIQGLKLDFTNMTTSTTGCYLCNHIGDGAKPIRIYDCEIVGGPIDGAAPGGIRSLMFYNSGGISFTTEAEGYEVAYCVWTNSLDPLRPWNVVYQPWSVHHNIFMWLADDATDETVRGIVPVSVTIPKTLNVSHNTFYFRDTFSGNKVVPPIVYSTTNATGIGLHSNLVLGNCAADVDATTPFAPILFGNSLTASGNGTRGTIGYNAILLGTNVPPISGWGAATGYYDDLVNPLFPSTPDLTQVYGTDLVVTNATHVGVFNGTTSWTWTDPRGGGYNHTLPYDLRPIVARALDINGEPAGAVKAAIAGPITPVTTSTTFAEGRNYLDSLPFYRPVFKADIQAMVRVDRNRTTGHIDMRHYLKDRIIDESTHRILEVAGSGRADVTLGGVAAASGFLLETDQTINVTMTYSGGTFTASVEEALVIDKTGVSAFSVNNTSSATATVQFIVFD